MGLGLSAPAAVPVEIHSPERRVFRLSREIGDGGLRLDRPAPFDIGRPVRVTFTLPDGPAVEFEASVELAGEPEEAEGARGGCRLLFRDVSLEMRKVLHRYILPRLGVPT